MSDIDMKERIRVGVRVRPLLERYTYRSRVSYLCICELLSGWVRCVRVLAIRKRKAALKL